MRSKSTIIIIVVAVIIIAGVGFVVANHKSSTGNEYGTGSTSDNTAPTPTSTTAKGTINITNMMFTPSQITVPVGGTVTWTNNDTTAHTVTIDHGNGPHSDPIAPGGTYSFTFTKAASYQYHCSIHPSMRGTIVVK
ncbi:MAG: plastocyanin [Candidatus Saccharibacteria bacterium]|nr:plastocyanin [Candidatus Saccharibacteria bacterium]